MFSKNLIKFSSYAVFGIGSKTRVNSTQIFENIIKTNVGFQKRNIFDNTDYKFEMPLLMGYEPKDTQFPPMIPFEVNFYFRYILDKSFNPERFTQKAKQTIATVSDHLSNSRLDRVKGTVSQEVFDQISKNIEKLSSEQKQRFKVKIDDILQCFPYSIRVDKVSDTTMKARILVVADVLHNASDPQKLKILSGLKTSEDDLDRTLNAFSLKVMEKLLEEKFVCVYEFSREYGPKGSRLPNWTVTKLYHFNTKDIMKLQKLI